MSPSSQIAALMADIMCSPSSLFLSDVYSNAAQNNRRFLNCLCPRQKLMQLQTSRPVVVHVRYVLSFKQCKLV